MPFPRHFPVFALGLLSVLSSAAWGGTATGVTGLYFTGTNDNGSLASNGSVDSHWSITYATTDGGNSANNTYQGSAYVLSASKNFSAWKDASNAQWIVPPHATSVTTYVTGSPAQTGYDAVPGNGTTGANAASYVYALTFNITGDNIGSVVTNQTSITLTLAADDQASVYVNPTLVGGAIDTANSTLAGAISNAWTNTQTLTLQNFADGTHADNAVFRVGANTLVVKVDNTNSITGSSNQTTANPSGLLVFQTGSAITITGKPIPEAGTWVTLVACAAWLVGARNRSRKQLSSTRA